MYGLSTGRRNLKVCCREKSTSGEVAVSGSSTVYSLYRFRKESNRSEYVREFSARTHLRLVPPRGVLNGLIEFKSALKIWPLLELLAKIR